eukprot:3960793-Prymnesium_polylepis.1
MSAARATTAAQSAWRCEGSASTRSCARARRRWGRRSRSAAATATPSPRSTAPTWPRRSGRRST